MCDKATDEEPPVQDAESTGESESCQIGETDGTYSRDHCHQPKKECIHCGMKFCPYHLFVNKNEGPLSFGGHDCPGVEGIRERVKSSISEIADSTTSTFSEIAESTEEKINELKEKISSTFDGSDEPQENSPTSEPAIEANNPELNEDAIEANNPESNGPVIEANNPEPC